MGLLSAEPLSNQILNFLASGADRVLCHWRYRSQWARCCGRVETAKLLFFTAAHGRR